MALAILLSLEGPGEEIAVPQNHVQVDQVEDDQQPPSHLGEGQPSKKRGRNDFMSTLDEVPV
jgi:hypothetical protein